MEQVVDGGEAEGQAECPERHRDGRARSGAKSRIDDRDAEQDGDGNEAAREVVAGGGARLRLEVVVVEDVQCHGGEAGTNDRRLEAHGSGEAEELAATLGEPLRDCVPATRTGVPRARSASRHAARAGSRPAFRRGSRRRRRRRASRTGTANTIPYWESAAVVSTARNMPTADPERRTDQRGDDALVPDHPPYLPAGHADRPQHPELACPLEDGEHERVDDAEQAHDHGEAEQGVEDLSATASISAVRVVLELVAGLDDRGRERCEALLERGGVRCPTGRRRC